MSDGIKRRDFLKVLGVSGAGTGLVGCSTDQVQKLIPYVTAPEEITPGVATWYSTVCGECSAGCGIWVRTREGRAVKIEGNPEHPLSEGALCSRGHASLQGLYNPDRLEGPLRRNDAGEFEPIRWDEAEALLAQSVGEADDGVVMISRREGPTLTELMDEVVGQAGGRRVEYEALSEAPLREAVRMAFGRDAVPTFRFEEADLVLSFGADFLETWLNPVEHGRDFARASGIDQAQEKARFVFLSPRLSLTGQNADEWFPLEPGSEGVVALAMANVLVGRGADAGPYADLVAAYDPASAAEVSGLPAEAITRLAEEFAAAEAPLAVGPGVAGQGANATAANLAVLVLNAVAGSIGRTLQVDRSDQAAPAAPFRELAEALDRMSAGEVQVAIVANTNPAYSLPPEAGLREAFTQVPFKVAVTPQLDETAELCDLVLPDRHPLESWGDANPRPGLWSIRQPVMQGVPHFDSRSLGDVLVRLAGGIGMDLGAETFHDYVRNRWSERHAGAGLEGSFEEFWRESLRMGVASFGAAEPEPVTLQAPDRALTFEGSELEGEGFALIVHPSPRLGDGKGANKPWLQELPDPVSKLAWQSWVEVHPETAEELGVQTGDIVRVTSPHGELQVQVWTYPGIRRDTVALAMGQGHENYGRYAEGRGVNPMTLLPARIEEPSGALAHLSVRVQLEPTGEHLVPASIEGSPQQFDRPIAPAVQLEELRSGEFHHEEPATRRELQAVGGFVPVPTAGQPEDYPLEGARHGEYDPEITPRWAMAIDLDKCTGCSACVTACQAENNVAFVGEEQLQMGRDLQWIRLERFYEEVDASEPGPLDIRFLPMLCQHCGNAPCEPVCPVYAAYHTPDGINAQIYNRCVGTRYCANNCPYKVRVFNWHRFSEVPEPLNWQYNPDVTVRTEGIMEKCTFCVQRIRSAENRAALEDRGLRTDEVVPACQQSCPAEAIVFGDLRDPESRVYQVSHDDRTYRVLDVLINTQPAINYLRKVTFHPVESIHV